jgi:hypothetical protein
MFRGAILFLAILLAFSWADDFYYSTASADPNDATCTESDLALAPATSRELVESHVVLRASVGGTGAVCLARSLKAPANQKSRWSPSQMTLSLGTVVPIRC